MSPMNRVRWVLWLTLTSWLLVLPGAQAYVDPGSTSLIFSWIVAGLAAAGMTLRIFWSRLKGLFRREDRPVSGSGDTDARDGATDETPRVGADSD